MRYWFYYSISWFFNFHLTTLVRWKWFVPQLYHFRRGISGGPALQYFHMIHRVGRCVSHLFSLWGLTMYWSIEIWSKEQDECGRWPAAAGARSQRQQLRERPEGDHLLVYPSPAEDRNGKRHEDDHNAAVVCTSYLWSRQREESSRCSGWTKVCPTKGEWIMDSKAFRHHCQRQCYGLRTCKDSAKQTCAQQ